ncbi:MAG TPA: HAMP domain-containing sensor histidine kinase [Myxococcota bacterium]|nr:HAMP domain-containing sensor histidine kinase [Myxococcota bacterium]HRY92741.1 HAMP domain-containing sensor histidine kinase [Myxococcota bacterium]HSA20717.1 HAMP domain-containing sensor histidine kinase [Myxococcota bacterium]
MEPTAIARFRHRARSLSFTSLIVALAVGVLLPVLLSTVVGIVSLALGDSSDPIATGVLVICFAAAAIGSVVTVTVLLGRRSRVARLQADLLANVSHDLRTPLAAIRMYAQTLRMGHLRDDPQRAEASLEVIIRETEWLETMLERVLTWRAAARDRDLLERRAEPLGPAVEEAARRFERLVAPGEVELAVSIQSQAPVLHDRQAISSVVLNLLINAYKYSLHEKRISVGVRALDGRIEIAVADHGIGIPRQELGRIFEPFYRVDSSLRGRASGAGLGLAIVRHLVEAHGGEVRVESSEGQGSRFSVLLPQADAPPVGSAP